MDCDSTLSPFLIPTVDSTDCVGVECLQDQSRAVVILIGTHQLVTETGGGGGGYYYMVVGHIIPRGKGVERHYYTFRRCDKGTFQQRTCGRCCVEDTYIVMFRTCNYCSLPMYWKSIPVVFLVPRLPHLILFPPNIFIADKLAVRVE